MNDLQEEALMQWSPSGGRGDPERLMAAFLNSQPAFTDELKRFMGCMEDATRGLLDASPVWGMLLSPRSSNNVGDRICAGLNALHARAVDCLPRWYLVGGRTEVWPALVPLLARDLPMRLLAVLLNAPVACDHTILRGVPRRFAESVAELALHIGESSEIGGAIGDGDEPDDAMKPAVTVRISASATPMSSSAPLSLELILNSAADPMDDGFYGACARRVAAALAYRVCDDMLSDDPILYGYSLSKGRGDAAPASLLHCVHTMKCLFEVHSKGTVDVVSDFFVGGLTQQEAADVLAISSYLQSVPRFCVGATLSGEDDASRRGGVFGLAAQAAMDRSLHKWVAVIVGYRRIGARIGGCSDIHSTQPILPPPTRGGDVGYDDRPAWEHAMTHLRSSAVARRVLGTALRASQGVQAAGRSPGWLSDDPFVSVSESVPEPAPAVYASAAASAAPSRDEVLRAITDQWQRSSTATTQELCCPRRMDDAITELSDSPSLLCSRVFGVPVCALYEHRGRFMNVPRTPLHVLIEIGRPMDDMENMEEGADEDDDDKEFRCCLDIEGTSHVGTLCSIPPGQRDAPGRPSRGATCDVRLLPPNCWLRIRAFSNPNPNRQVPLAAIGVRLSHAAMNALTMPSTADIGAILTTPPDAAATEATWRTTVD